MGKGSFVEGGKIFFDYDFVIGKDVDGNYCVVIGCFCKGGIYCFVVVQLEYMFGCCIVI